MCVVWCISCVRLSLCVLCVCVSSLSQLHCALAPANCPTTPIFVHSGPSLFPPHASPPHPLTTLQCTHRSSRGLSSVPPSQLRVCARAPLPLPPPEIEKCDLSTLQPKLSKPLTLKRKQGIGLQPVARRCARSRRSALRLVARGKGILF